MSELEAEEWLKNLLSEADGCQMPCDEVRTLAKRASITKGTLKAVRTLLGVKAKFDYASEEPNAPKIWLWYLPKEGRNERKTN